MTPPAWLLRFGWPNLVAEPLAGLLVGVACGTLLMLATKGVSRPPRLAGLLAIAGVFLGWQAAISAATIAAGLFFVAALLHPRLPVPRLASLVFVALLVQILFWNRWDRLLGWPIALAPGWGVANSLGILLLASAAAGYILERKRPRAET